MMMSVHSFVLCCVLLIVAVQALAINPENVHEKFKPFREECLKIHPDIDLTVFKSDKFDPKILEEKAYKCFDLCILQKSGLSDEDGKLNVEKMLEIYEMPSNVTEAAKMCVDKEAKETDPCDRLQNILFCVFKQLKET